ncbi:hypothetical protein ACQ4N7_28610 [Nodosilinea sp. AN01ver1]|uniref:hypothetical protein n=1 Tax=Nodosilinea sp. AN01ver1 TaxID=3423362 RepID=UPI003D320DF6
MKPLIKKHFELLEAIQSNYKLRDKEPGALEKAIAACNQQIAIAPEVAQLFHQEFEELSQFAVEQALPESAAALPVHTGYTQLAIIREKQGRLTEAICLCREAQAQGWAGDWENRIARYQKHQARNTEC